jgi:DNA-directed RNA polymerase specialized sigma24 family protein
MVAGERMSRRHEGAADGGSTDGATAAPGTTVRGTTARGTTARGTTVRGATARGADGAPDAFDRLHDENVPSLTRQAFLLCGQRRLARRSVCHAFRRAWQRWPDVAVDADPAGWVRVATYQYALAPWRDFGPLRLIRRARAMRYVPPRDRTLLDALLRLPRSYRAAVLLCDGLGLSLADTAAEVEAGTSATAGRLRHARAALAERVPELREVAPDELADRTACLVRQLAAPQPASPPSASRVRRGSSVRTWCSTTAALGLTAAVAGAGVALVATDGERNVTPVPVPKHPSATLAPDQQPGRLTPKV